MSYFYRSPLTGRVGPSGPLAQALQDAGIGIVIHYIMIYQPIKYPFSSNFREMSKGELREYWEWFFSVMGERVTELESAVSSTLGYEDWVATFTPNSLDILGDWFKSVVALDPAPPGAVKILVLRAGVASVPEDPDITGETLSVAFDVGFYLVCTLKRQYPVLCWKQYTNNKRFVDYGQPVLEHFGSVSMNPIRISMVLARALASGERTGARLRELYDLWSANVSM